MLLLFQLLLGTAAGGAGGSAGGCCCGGCGGYGGCCCGCGGGSAGAGACCWAPQLVVLVAVLGKQHRLSCNVFLTLCTLAIAFLLLNSCTVFSTLALSLAMAFLLFYSCTISCHVFFYTGITPLMSSVRLTFAADSSNTPC